MKTHSFWYPSAVGLICMMLGLTFCRFSYTPMIPFLVNHQWLSADQANYVGAYNFLGYFMGAACAFTLSHYFKKTILIRTALIFVIISLLLCACPFGFIWLASWRFLAGILGAFLLILSPSFVLGFVPQKKRALSSGIIFTGIGLGIILSSLIIPELAALSLTVMWLFFASISCILMVFSWPLFRRTLPDIPHKTSQEKHPNNTRTLCLLGLAYILCGIAVVPHTLFLSHYLNQDLHLSLANSGRLFALFGLGGLLGSFLGGLASARLGVYLALIISALIGIFAISLLITTEEIILISCSAFLIGIYLFATVNLLSLRTSEVSPTELHAKYWGRITLCFAIGQAGGAYGLSALLAHGASYIQTFWIAGIALTASFILLCLAQ